MHDFCFTIPYGFAVLTGGVLGYLRRGSTASLAGGAGAGALLILAGFVSLKAFEKRRKSYLAFALETLKQISRLQLGGRSLPDLLEKGWAFWVIYHIAMRCFRSEIEDQPGGIQGGADVLTVCALALTYVMGQRYLETSKIIPAGIVAGLSAVMSTFYLFKIATGGNHIPQKKE
ncbi:hypothetical protein GUJ93_ZPchr0003g16499 [Zizania palustris]|uniref:Uncharacterized protein n=1 Tax=Zizania palustris TaxID=103762 RepID=A0A8J5VK22_ZIZPA|nr:hypothetical protein GUJ93_ZPchr0003g16499 [Zizania palustris]